jgi:hypothetical protein
VLATAMPATANANIFLFISQTFLIIKKILVFYTLYCSQPNFTAEKFFT